MLWPSANLFLPENRRAIYQGRFGKDCNEREFANYAKGCNSHYTALLKILSVYNE